MPFDDYGATGKHTETYTEALKVAKLGTRLQLEDGRVFHYARAGGALAVGQLCQQAVGVANHDSDLVVATTGAIGDNELVVTLGATAMTLNQYENGYLHVNDETAQGAVYTIDSHAAVDSDGNFTVPIKDDGGLRVSIVAADSQVGLTPNLWGDVIKFPVTTATGVTAGVSPVAVDNDAYFWCQTWGMCAILSDSTTFVIGKGIEPSAVAGSVALADRSGSTDFHGIGAVSNTIPVNTEYNMFYLMVSP
jgi:hypothetical protein